MLAQPWFRALFVAAGAVLVAPPDLSAQSKKPVQLTASEVNALSQRLQQCWNIPPALAGARDLVVTLHIRFSRDGSLAGTPEVVNRSPNPLFQAAAENAIRSVRECAPFVFLPRAKYDLWKDIEVNFDAHEFPDSKPN